MPCPYQCRMADDERTDPVAGFRFAVKVEGVVTGWFVKCSGLTVEREPIPYEEGGVNDYVHQLPGRITHARITLEHGLADNKLWNWFQEGLYDGKVTRRHVSVILYDSDLTQFKQWDLDNAYPLKWTGPDFQSDTDQVAVETLEIVSGGGGETFVQRETSEGTMSEKIPAAAEQEPEIDLPALADKVYALLKQELRIDRERLGRKWL
jgi:phage tail-like protein